MKCAIFDSIKLKMSAMNFEKFSPENREAYLHETTESLDALLNDALIGGDQNQLKSDFPKGCQRADVKIENTRVSLTFINDSEIPQIEVVVQFSFDGVAIGEYRSAYDIHELQDEFFYLE